MRLARGHRRDERTERRERQHPITPTPRRRPRRRRDGDARRHQRRLLVGVGRGHARGDRRHVARGVRRRSPARSRRRVTFRNLRRAFVIINKYTRLSSSRLVAPRPRPGFARATPSDRRSPRDDDRRARDGAGVR